VLQFFLTYTPGINSFLHMGEGMSGIQWARAFASMFIVYFVVEFEKALVDPVLMPIFVRPVLNWVEKHTPDWLSMPKPHKWKGCRKGGVVKYSDEAAS
jgi:hypothetical protein